MSANAWTCPISRAAAAPSPCTVYHARRPAAGRSRFGCAKLAAELRSLALDAFLGGASRLAGRPQFLNLQPIKERYKGDWEQISTRIDRLVTIRIERHLTPGDLYHRVRPTEYVIVFAGLSVEAAQTKCALIARKIGQAVLGESNAEELPIGANALPILQTQTPQRMVRFGLTELYRPRA